MGGGASKPIHRSRVSKVLRNQSTDDSKSASKKEQESDTTTSPPCEKRPCLKWGTVCSLLKEMESASSTQPQRYCDERHALDISQCPPNINKCSSCKKPLEHEDCGICFLCRKYLCQTCLSRKDAGEALDAEFFFDGKERPRNMANKDFIKKLESGCRWLLRVLPHVYKDQRLKWAVRMVISNEDFSANLAVTTGHVSAFQFLQNGTSVLLHDLGQELKVLYETEQLFKRLGSFSPTMIKNHSKRQDRDLALPPSCDWSAERQEQCYIHFLRLIAYAVDQPFQKLVQDCVKDFIVDDQPFTHGGIEGIKGYLRMFNKLRADHRYDKKPRPAQNVDINRCLVAAKNWKGMLGVMGALRNQFGAFAKFKNQMNFPVDVAEKLHHLRIMMVSVRYDTGLTFGDLCTSKRVQQLWNEYGAVPPPRAVPGGRWNSQVRTALQWLRSPELTNKKVILLCEVQCVLAQYRDVRLKMHEIYKVNRADDGNALFNDFCEIRTKLEKHKQRLDDGCTPHRRQCRDNRPTNGLRLTDDLEECLYVALRNGSDDALKVLVSAPDAEYTIKKHSAWMFSCCICASYHTKILSMVKELVDCKANVSQQKSTGASALHMACQEGHVDVCELLLAKKAAVNQTKVNGVSALYMASQEDHMDVCELLLANKANVNSTKLNGASPLVMACQEGHAEICELLVANRADVNQSSRDGQSSLFLACDKGHSDLCKLLLDNQADINQTDMNGTSPMFIAGLHGHVDVCKLLLASKAEVDETDANGTSLLVAACQAGHGDICELLLANKAYVNQATPDGSSALLLACQNGYLGVCGPLLANKAEVNQARSDGASPLLLACAKGCVDVCELLLANKAFVKQTTSGGDSALLMASKQGHTEVCKLLINKKADVNHKNKSGDTAVAMASRFEHSETVSLLVSAKADTSGIAIGTGRKHGGNEDKFSLDFDNLSDDFSYY